jgi:hypothetical protein
MFELAPASSTGIDGRWSRPSDTAARVLAEAVLEREFLT